MPIDSYRRVLWRITEKHPEMGKNHAEMHKISTKELRNAIYQEIGLDERTIRKTIKRLKELGWIKHVRSELFITPEGIQNS